MSCPPGVVYSGNELREQLYSAVADYNNKYTSLESSPVLTLEIRDIPVDDVSDSVVMHKAGESSKLQSKFMYIKLH